MLAGCSIVGLLRADVQYTTLSRLNDGCREPYEMNRIHSIQQIHARIGDLIHHKAVFLPIYFRSTSQNPACSIPF